MKSTISLKKFDRFGDEFYAQVSALHKSIRGSDPDASIYWFSRMVDGGIDLPTSEGGFFGFLAKMWVLRTQEL